MEREACLPNTGSRTDNRKGNFRCLFQQALKLARKVPVRQPQAVDWRTGIPGPHPRSCYSLESDLGPPTNMYGVIRYTCTCTQKHREGRSLIDKPLVNHTTFSQRGGVESCPAQPPHSHKLSQVVCWTWITKLPTSTGYWSLLSKETAILTRVNPSLLSIEEGTGCSPTTPLKPPSCLANSLETRDPGLGDGLNLLATGSCRHSLCQAVPQTRYGEITQVF